MEVNGTHGEGIQTFQGNNSPTPEKAWLRKAVRRFATKLRRHDRCSATVCFKSVSLHSSPLLMALRGRHSYAWPVAPRVASLHGSAGILVCAVCTPWQSGLLGRSGGGCRLQLQSLNQHGAAHCSCQFEVLLVLWQLHHRWSQAVCRTLNDSCGSAICLRKQKTGSKLCWGPSRTF